MENNERVLLHRIDERMTLIMDKILDIRTDMEKTKKEHTEIFISREEFEPVKRIVYGIVTAMFIGVMTALGTLVLKLN